MKRTGIDKIENIGQVKAVLFMLLEAHCRGNTDGKAKLEVGDSYLDKSPELKGLVNNTLLIKLEVNDET